jgi:hypothetical protein
MIYGVAESWTATMSCAHEISVTSKLKVTFPSGWYVMETSTCKVTGQNSAYTCVASNTDRTILISAFASATISKETEFSISFNSV